jgi:nitroreductase
MTTIDELVHRTSVRVFEARPVPEEVKSAVLECAFAAPTAGNQMMYTILDIQDQSLKSTLARLCDNQPFIAVAPWVLVFLADCRRWHDAYRLAGATPRDPGLGDVLLACQDALIAAQNAVVAAHSLGVGSCYIGDIMENREQIVSVLNLDEWVLPATMVVFGYPTAQQLRRPKPRRFDRRFIVLADQYRRLSDDEQRQMFAARGQNFDTYLPRFCQRKYMSDFAVEMTRSVAGYLSAYRNPSGDSE